MWYRNPPFYLPLTFFNNKLYNTYKIIQSKEKNRHFMTILDKKLSSILLNIYSFDEFSVSKMYQIFNSYVLINNENIYILN